jgi:predicted phage terminase large subunit-like protein
MSLPKLRFPKKKKKARIIPPPPMGVDEKDLLRELVKESFYDFVREFWHVIVPEEPVWNWHIQYLCDELQEMAERVFKGETKEYDLVVNIPPGTSKSTICSVMFPIWVWTRMPQARSICASHGYNLALDLSRKSRMVVKSDLFRTLFPEIQLQEDQDSKGFFVNTLGGGRYAVGSDGSVIGQHAHFIIVDDPLNPKEAASEATLNSCKVWLRDELFSRKVEKRLTVTIMVMQRVGQDDPTEMMLQRPKVKHVCLPAEDAYEVKPESLRRFYVGGLLDPVRMDREVLAEVMTEGDHLYATQYGQAPLPLGGGMFKTDRLKYEHLTEQLAEIVRFWDKAATAGAGAYTVGVLMGVTARGRYYVLDVIRGRWDSYERERIIHRTAVQDGLHVMVGIEQEGAGGGKESAENTVRRLAGFRVHVSIPKGDKALRADPFSTQVNAGNVVIQPAAWNKVFVDEMKHFPLSKYKDQIDAAAGAFSYLSQGRMRIGGLKRKGKLSEPD